MRFRELIVLKHTRRHTHFDRITARKRPPEPARVERMISEVVRQLEKHGPNRTAILHHRRTDDEAPEATR